MYRVICVQQEGGRIVNKWHVGHLNVEDLGKAHEELRAILLEAGLPNGGRCANRFGGVTYVLGSSRFLELEYSEPASVSSLKLHFSPTRRQ